MPPPYGEPREEAACASLVFVHCAMEA